ncbi:MAG: chemotaxis protein CheA [bacterium]
MDDQAFQEFLAEYGELIEQLPPAIMELEDNPRDMQYVEEPFRILHSIKGMASFFSLSPVKNVAHRLEDLLSVIKEEHDLVGSEVIDVLLEGANVLERFYDRVSSGKKDVELTAADEDLLERVENLKESGVGLESFVESLLVDLKDISEQMTEDDELAGHSLVENFNSLLMEAEATLEAREEEEDQVRSAIFIDSEVVVEEVEFSEALHNLEEIAGECARENLESIESEEEEKFVENLEKFKEYSENAGIENLVEIASQIESEYNRFKETTGFNYIFAGSVLDHLIEVKKEIEEAGGTIQKDEQAEKEAVKESSVQRTFRVAENRVDEFMDYVGELIITGEMYSHLSRQLAEKDVNSGLLNQLNDINLSFKKLSDNLQESLLEIRRVSVENVLKKFQARARKLSGELEKEVKIELEGAKTEVDKSLVEVLETPLTHLVRNAVDHGIEAPDDREAAGKNRCGNLKICVDAEEEDLVVVVEDDGAGLDTESIKNKAIEQGLVGAEDAEKMEKEEIHRFVLKSGFSTSDEVSDVSGRGVGMDAVKEELKRVNGEIDVHSEAGEFTRWEMRLPRAQTVVVEQGLVVTGNSQRYVIPLESVYESISLSKVKTTFVEDRGEMINIRGDLYPIYWLGEVMDGKDYEKAEEDVVILVLEGEFERYAVAVDEIREQNKVVLQELGPAFQEVDYASGCALMGDGTVSLFIDPDGLLAAARGGK